MPAAYDETKKALAVGIVERFGGEISQEALAMIRQSLEMPTLNKSTVYRWWQARDRTVATELQPAATPKKADLDQALDELFERTARLYLAHAQTEAVIADTKGKDAVIAAATATDKMRLLRNLPTEIVSVVPEVVESLRGAGLDPLTVFRTIIAEAKAKREYELLHSN